ncbi:MAG: DUF4398 domain-containing protein [Gammaproteobacteria bacterium]
MPTANSIPRHPLLLASALLVVAASGCSSVPPAGPDVARAAAQIEQAQQAGAGEFAPVELKSASDNLRLAQTADAKGDDREATAFAVRAQLDGQLAESKARSQQAAKAAAAVEKGTQTLREETQRAIENNPPVTVAPTTPANPDRQVAP